MKRLAVCVDEISAKRLGFLYARVVLGQLSRYLEFVATYLLRAHPRVSLFLGSNPSIRQEGA